MWQVVFANVPVEGRIVDSDVNDFFDGYGHTMSLHSYNLEVFHWCCVASSIIIMFKYWWWCLQVLFVSFLKGSGWIPNILIITLSPATFIPVYDVTLFVMDSLSLGNINRYLMCSHPWSIPGLHTCYRQSCNFHIGLWCKVPLCDISGWCFCLGLFCFLFFCILVASIPCW